MIVSHFLPFPTDAGGKTRIFNLLRPLSLHHEIMFVWLNDGSGGSLEDARQAVGGVEFREIKAAPGFWRIPYYVFTFIGLGGIFVSGALKKKIEVLATAWRAEAVQFEFSQSAKFLPSSIVDAILVVHEIRWKRMARKLDGGGALAIFSAFFRSWLMRKEELSSFKKFKTLVAMSEADRRTLLKALPGKRIEMIPNGVDVASCRYQVPSGLKKKLFLLGWFGNEQNLQGLEFFAKEVWPKIIHKPGVDIFGAGLSGPLLDMCQMLGWKYHGYVDEDFLAEIVKDSLLVVPLLSGGGTRLKVLEAFARGNPVVSTSIGAEGIDVVDGEHLLIGNSAEGLARHVDGLLSDDSFWVKLSANARRLVEERYDWSAIAAKNELIYERK
jgi:polysaccharide biosynthesis protein PslH